MDMRKTLLLYDDEFQHQTAKFHIDHYVQIDNVYHCGTKKYESITLSKYDIERIYKEMFPNEVTKNER